MKAILTLILLLPMICWSKPTFKTKKVKLGNNTLTVELANTNELRAQGLMNRTSLKPSWGMLFIFEDERTQSFWMKNTFIPLSIGFFNAQRKLVDIQDMTPARSLMEKNLKSYYSKHPALYALEVNQGWFKKHKIKLGDRLIIQN